MEGPTTKCLKNEGIRGRIEVRHRQAVAGDGKALPERGWRTSSRQIENGIATKTITRETEDTLEADLAGVDRRLRARA